MKNRKCAKKRSCCRNDDVALGKDAEILSKNRGPREWHAGTHVRMVKWQCPEATVNGNDRQLNPFKIQWKTKTVDCSDASITNH